MGTYTTFHPHKIRRKRTLGFLEKMSSAGGRKILKKRRNKGRKKLTV